MKPKTIHDLWDGVSFRASLISSFRELTENGKITWISGWRVIPNQRFHEKFIIGVRRMFWNPKTFLCTIKYFIRYIPRRISGVWRKKKNELIYRRKIK